MADNIFIADVNSSDSAPAPVDRSQMAASFLMSDIHSAPAPQAQEEDDEMFASMLFGKSTFGS